MKIKSVAGVSCYVKNINRTVKFYEALGFTFRKKESKRAVGYSNWFWIDFLSAEAETRAEFRKEAKLANKGAGVFLYLSVDDVDAFYKGLRSKGLKPSGEPQDTALGNREFVIRDPDGYKLVVFKRL